jgi:hypothetical protein
LNLPGVAHCLAKSPPSRHTEPLRPSPPATTVHPHRRPLRPNFCHHRVLGEHMVEPDPFPGWEYCRLAGIGRSRATPTAKGRIASPQIFLGCSVQSKGIFVKVEKDLGAWCKLGTSIVKGFS